MCTQESFSRQAVFSLKVGSPCRYYCLIFPRFDYLKIVFFYLGSQKKFAVEQRAS